MQLLEIIDSNKYVETYRYFPDVVLCGKQFLNKEEINALVEEGLLKTVKQDSFGEFLQLSEKGKELLQKEINSITVPLT